MFLLLPHQHYYLCHGELGLHWKAAEPYTDAHGRIQSFSLLLLLERELPSHHGVQYSPGIVSPMLSERGRLAYSQQ